MKRVMIVDDEFLVRLGIKSLLPWEDYGYEIAGEAENGQEALEKIEKMRPHIILTDLIMSPGNGFMLIEQCRQKYPETKFVVLSNYNDFENVRRAMKLGADDYVFKLTLKDKELLQILDEVSRDDEVQEREEEEGKEPQRTGGGTVRNRELVKAGILKNLMEAREGYYEVSLKALADYPCNIDFEDPWRIITITLDDISIARCSGNFLESDLLKFAIENMINEIFDDQGEREIFQFRECDFILVLRSVEEKESFREIMEEEFSRLCQYVRKYCGLHVSGVISPQSRGIHLLREKILENETALKHRFWNMQETLLWAENAAEDTGMPLHEAESDTDGAVVLESRLQEEGIGAGLSCWEDLMEERRRICGGDVQAFREFLLALYRVLAWYMKKSGIDMRHILDSNGVNLETAIREYDFYEEVRESFAQLREQYLAFYGEKQRRPCRKEIVEVKSFVQAHYGEKLSVAQIAEMINMSESRFAHVFKKEAGISFWEYVNQVRMDQAEKLLRETDLRIGDIAEKIGVDNANYFSAQFKKRKGKSPLAYRNMPEQ